MRKLLSLTILTTILFLAGQGKGQDSAFQGRVEIDGRGFAIYPPSGWSVEENFNGASLFYQAPLDKSHKYQRNIRIMTFKGPKFIDEVSLDEFSKEIEEKSSKMSNAVENYRIRDLSLVELGDSIPAGLFYGDFLLNGLAMMQMHLLVSSSEFHFLMTYTDVQENFEDTNNGFLDQAYQSFQTVELDSSAPGRNDFLINIGASLAAFILLVLLFSFYRKHNVKKLGEGIDEYDDDDTDHSELAETAASAVKLNESDHIDVSEGPQTLVKKKKGIFTRKKKEGEHDDLDVDLGDDIKDDEDDDEWKVT